MKMSLAAKIMAIISTLATVGVVAVLAVILVTGGYFNGGNSGGGENGTNSTTDETEDVIMPSKIITLEDAERILGIDMCVFEELDKKQTGPYDGDNSYKTCYTFDGDGFFTHYMLQVSQGSPLSRPLDEVKKDYPNQDNWVEGVGDWARLSTSPLHTILVVYKGYSFQLILTGNHNIRSDEEESAWKVAVLKEAGKCGIERLEALIK
jgi:hypothetical protein